MCCPLSQYLRVDMRDDLVAVARTAAVEIGRQGALGDEAKRLGPALPSRDLRFVLCTFVALIARGLERPLHDRPYLGGESASDDHRAVVVYPRAEMSTLVATPVFVLGCPRAVGLSPRSHESLNMRRCSTAREVEQRLLVL